MCWRSMVAVAGVAVAATVPGAVAPLGVLLAVPLLAWLALARRRWLGIAVGVTLMAALVVAHILYRWYVRDAYLPAADVTPLLGATVGVLALAVLADRLVPHRARPADHGRPRTACLIFGVALGLLSLALVAVRAALGPNPDNPVGPDVSRVLPLPADLTHTATHTDCGATGICQVSLSVASPDHATSAMVRRRLIDHLARLGWTGGNCRAIRGLLMWGYQCYDLNPTSAGTVELVLHTEPASGCWYFERPTGLCPTPTR